MPSTHGPIPSRPKTFLEYVLAACPKRRRPEYVFVGVHLTLAASWSEFSQWQLLIRQLAEHGLGSGPKRLEASNKKKPAEAGFKETTDGSFQ
jgi:hypothetical protein